MAIDFMSQKCSTPEPNKLTSSEIDILLQTISNDFSRSTNVFIKPDTLEAGAFRRLIKNLETLDLPSLETIFATLLKMENLKPKIFIQALPYIGTEPSVLLIRNLLRKNKIEKIYAEKLLMEFPTHVKCPTEQLLEQFEEILNVYELGSELHQVAALSFASLIQHTLERTTKFPFIDKYVGLYLEMYTISDGFRSKILYLECLSNMGLLEEGLQGILETETDPTLIAHILFATSSSDTHDSFIPSIWKVLSNRTNPSSLRMVAYRMYTKTKKPNVEHFMKLHRFMLDENNERLYEFHYKALETFARPSTFYHSSKKISEICRFLLSISRKPMVQLETSDFMVFEHLDEEQGSGVRIEYTQIKAYELNWFEGSLTFKSADGTNQLAGVYGTVDIDRKYR